MFLNANDFSDADELFQFLGQRLLKAFAKMREK
jgi:hypothetical protein